MPPLYTAHSGSANRGLEVGYHRLKLERDRPRAEVEVHGLPAVYLLDRKRRPDSMKRPAQRALVRPLCDRAERHVIGGDIDQQMLVGA